MLRQLSVQGPGTDLVLLHPAVGNPILETGCPVALLQESRVLLNEPRVCQ